MKLNESFFKKDSEKVAQELLGKKLVKTVGNERLEGIITMTSAYQGEAKRKQPGLFYSPGQLYLPTFSGGYRKLAIATESSKKASVITIDKILTDKLVLSSSKICEYFQLGKEDDNKSVCGNNIWTEGEKTDYSIEKVNEGTSSNCVGRYKIRI